MIERYLTKAMAPVWTEEAKFNAFLEIEILNAEALAEQGIVPKADLVAIKTKATYDIRRVRELENETKHDVIAFTRAVSESLGPEKRFIHYGLTSTDVVDTAYGVLYKKANAIILADLRRFLEVLKKQSYQFQTTMCIGRTHGMHAEITSFGLKWTLWYSEMERNLRRFIDACQDVEVGKISGAVGNYAFTDPVVERYILAKLGLGRPAVSTQTLQRDRHAHYISVLALIGSTLEKIAVEIRHLMRTEVGEVSEPFASGQKGSSAMPHKRNPISSENITGLSRVLRGYTIPMLESVALWHERDISHSSVERIVIPDATALIDYMLTRYAATLEGLIVNQERMLANIMITQGVVFSQRVLGKLLEKGMTREAAYDLVQSIAQHALSTNTPFRTLLSVDPTIQSHLTNAEQADCFTLDFYLKHIDTIYQQVFAPEGHS
jgi:adenylosuccinate lyase